MGGCRHRDTVCMEEEGCYSCCCSGTEAGLHRQDVLIRLLLRRESRQQRLAWGFAAGLLVLLTGSLALLVTQVLGGRGGHSQPVMQPDSHSSGVSSQQQDHHHHHHHHQQQQQQDLKNPRAMLTAPRGNIVKGNYLQWEKNDDLAFCHGGFNYSNGNLIVPRKGIYRVFLQITYESRDNPECVNELRLSNSVLSIRESYGDDERLLSSVDSVNCSMQQWRKSLYTAGLFSLAAGSSLRVTSLEHDSIVQSQSETFFGAELLSE
ncbi:lymphotoxin-alpha-like [Clinocottus analis]|uniref:lymphotoxin-alpha-like n=1 Tax=Clinocottus analis TaxID=304258 RepID=UPI0035C0CBA1